MSHDPSRPGIGCVDAGMTGGSGIGCAMDIAGVALGGLGKIVDVVRGFAKLTALAGDAVDTMRYTTGGVGFALGGTMNAAGWGEYLRG